MIELPPGATQRGVQSLGRIDRKGGRYRLALAYGPYEPERARIMVSRLVAAKQEGLRVAFPLLHSQGSPGAPLTVGALTTGRTLPLDGLTPGYTVKEGYYLSLEKAGRHYFHSVHTGGVANGSGALTVTLNEMLRDTFPDNTPVHLAKPMIEGLIEGDEWGWQAAVDRVTPIEFALEEMR